MASSTETTPGLTLPCPCCGEGGASIVFHLVDGQTFTCQECSNEFTADDIDDFIARWQKVLAWVRTMPGAE